MGFDITWIAGSIYHGYGVQNTMDRGFKKWYIEYPIHGILTTPYPWYIENPTHGILTPLSTVF
jgi:hypothetical protein